MTTTYQPWTEYTADGATQRYTFGFPYLSRSHIGVTRNGGAAAIFTWVDDSTLDIHTIYGDPIPEGEPIKIYRSTPDLDAFAEFKDASLMTATDLNRARLQVLYLVQERSGGIAGTVTSVITTLTTELETVSGALDSIAYSQGILTAGLQTLDTLTERITTAESSQAALRELLDETIANFDTTTGTIVTRLDAVEASQSNLSASVNQQIATLAGQDMAIASRLDTVEASVAAIDTGEDDDGDDREDEIIAASILGSTIATATQNYSQAQQITTLQAQYQGVNALIETVQNAYAAADEALAEQITTLQSQIGENVAQLIEDLSTRVTTVEGEVDTVAANYTLKVLAQRTDGKVVTAGIGLNATSSDDYTGSEIVMVADRLVFVDGDSVNGDLTYLFEAGTVDGASTFILNSTTVGDKTLGARMYVDGSIETRTLAAEAVTADKLKAGAVTVEKLDVNLGTNLLKASSFVDALTGWTYSNNLDSTNVTTGVDLGGSTWYPLGGHAATIVQGDQNYAGYDVGSRFAELTSELVPATAGERYEFSCYTGAHRSTVRIYLVFVDSSGAQVGVAQSTEDNAAVASGGMGLSGYKRLYNFATAPANTAAMRLLIRKGPTYAGETDSYLFATQPFVAIALANQTRASAYTPSGLGTTVTASGITTPSLAALSATIGILRTATSGARTEIEDNQIRVYDANNVLRVRMGVW